MPKLTIIIMEKAQPLSDGHNLTGYTTDVQFEAEGQEGSPLKKLVGPIYEAIGYMLTALHGGEPYVARDFESHESVSLEAEMAKEVAKLEAPFPLEIET